MGGTEVYVANLTQELSHLGVDSCIAIASQADENHTYEGVRVCRYSACKQSERLIDYYGGTNEPDPGFVRMLEREKPDLLHLHAYSSFTSLGMVRIAKQRHIPVLFTYHTPTATCQRGTMLHWGEKPCDGRLNLHACARCTLDGLFQPKAESGKPKVETKRILAWLAGTLPPALGSVLGQCGLQGGVWTALRMTELIHSSQATTRAFLTEVNHIVAVCQWVKAVLIRNEVAEERITLCRQGFGGGKAERRELDNGKHETPAKTSDLRLCFFGRLDHTKGVHLLIQVMRTMPQASLQLDIYGVVQGEAGGKYEQKLRQMAAGDNRIKFCPPVTTAEISGRMKQYDLLVVPSQILETGPLVVLEAFAAGLPVIGSRLGGIGELVEDEVNGILVEAGSTAAWRVALARFFDEPMLLGKLRRGIQPPRRMKDVAKDMMVTYNRLLTTQPPCALL